MSNSTVTALLGVIDQAFDKQSWHGTNLRGSIRRVTFREAGWRPHPDRHSIREIVVHCAYWKYTIRRRLLGEKRGSFPRKGSDWFPPGESSEAAWREDVQLLVDTHQSMRAAIAEMNDADLDRATGGGTTTNFALISGIAAHDLYHAGQIQLLKKLHASL